MTFTNRVFGEGEKPHFTFDQDKGVNAYNKYFYVRLGIVLEFNYLRYEMKIKWLGDKGARVDIPITFPYIGPAGCIGAVPEKGAIGIFAFYDEGGGKGSPLCMGFLPSGLGMAIDHNEVKILPDFMPTTDMNEVRFKFHELKEGDMIIASPNGGYGLFNSSILLKDSQGNNISIREGDNSILSSSINNFMFSDGAAVYAGPVMRNSLVIYDSNGKKLPFIPAFVETLPNGKNNTYIVPYNGSGRYDTQHYSEYRIDVDEICDRVQDLNDINGECPVSTRNPIVIQALGNYIGADRRNEQTYGMPLKPVIFSSDTDTIGQFNLIRASQNNTIDEPFVLGMAFAQHFLKSGAFLGVDKEGHYYMNLPSSKSNSLGAGRSMSILGQGNLKEIWGPAASDKNSWDLTAKGGIRWDVGAHNATRQGRSIEIKTDNGVYLEVGNNADDGYAKQELIYGNVLETVSGNKTENANSLDMTIKGLKTEKIAGSSQESVQGNKTSTVTGTSTEIALTEKQCTFGKRKTTIVGNDELTVIRGNIKQSITTIGNHTTSVTTGNIEDNIIAGSRKVSIRAGTVKIEVTAGAININTKAGTVGIGGTTITLDGKILTNIKGPLVRIGNGALIGGVVSGLPGKITHLDFLTGLPLKGSLKVSVG